MGHAGIGSGDLLGSGSRWPVVGRAAEAEWLRGRLLRAEPSVVAGAAGVGKTHLVRSVLDTLQAADWSVRWVWGTASARMVPFAPFGALSTSGTPMDPAARMDWLVRRLGEQVEDGPVAVAIDDAHLLDGASAALVARLAREREVSVVATVRHGEPAPDAVVGLWSTGPAERMELVPLDRAALAELATRVLGGAVADDAVDRLWSMTRGNPLHVREVLIASVGSGTPEPAGEPWRADDLQPSGARLDEYVASRIGSLPETVADGLAGAALAEGLPWKLLEAAVGRAVTDELEDRALVAASAHSEAPVRVIHPLYAETVRAQMPADRLRGIARSLMAAMERAGPIEGESLLRAADLRLAVGDLSDVELLVAAGQHAASAGYGPVGERFGRAALAAGAGTPARLVLATALRQQGRVRDALEVLAGGADEVTTDAERAGLAIYRSLALQILGDLPEALRVLSDARAAVTASHLAADLDAQRAILFMAVGRMEESVRLAERLPVDDRHPLPVQLHVAAAHAATAFRGRADAAVDAMRPWLDERRDALLQVPEAAMHLWLGTSFTEMIRWRFDAGIEAAAAQVQELSEKRAWSLAGDFATVKAFGLLQSGRPRSALREIQAARSMWQRTGPGVYQALAFAVAAQSSALVGDLVDARSQVREVGRLLERGANYLPMHQVDIDIARAWVAVLSGDHDVGLRRARDAVRFARDGGDLVRECQALHTLGRLGQPREVAARVSELAPELDGAGWAAVCWHVEGLAHGNPEELSRAADRFEDVGAWLLAGEAWAEVVSLHTRSGDARRAGAARRRAHAAASRCESGRTPAFEALDRPILTRRQREIARLAADGRSNPEIAESLTISVRTVENHLQRVYERLDISGRRELSEPLGRGGVLAPSADPTVAKDE